MKDFNRHVIEEFRANEGRVGGAWEGLPMALLTTTGAKTGRPHTTPLVYLHDGDRVVVFASKGGSPTHPEWFLNLRANPEATVEVGTEKYPVRAEITSGQERDRLFNEQASRMPTFRQYQERTSRTIPVIVLTRADKP
jgi:deazaflavin-dependent oxidoreductase (nitroreductase family)